MSQCSQRVKVCLSLVQFQNTEREVRLAPFVTPYPIRDLCRKFQKTEEFSLEYFIFTFHCY